MFRHFQVFDYQTGESIKLHPAEKNRHFYGHGVFSNDHQWLFATEGERGTSRGIIGVYDVLAGYKKVAEFTDFGLGPHEVIIMKDNTFHICIFDGIIRIITLQNGTIFILLCFAGYVN